MSPPDSPYRGLADAGCPGHQGPAPVRGVRRLPFDRLLHDPGPLPAAAFNETIAPDQSLLTSRCTNLATGESPAQATPVASGLGINILNYGGTVADGVFYLLNGNRFVGVDLYTVDLSTGIASFVGATGLFDNGIGLALDGDGGLVAVINDSLYEINRATGAATAVGNTGFTAMSSLEFVVRCTLYALPVPVKDRGRTTASTFRAFPERPRC